MYLMKRANGDLFTLTVGGNEYVAVWPNEFAARRYKARNPELLVYLPARIDRALVERKLGRLLHEQSLRFWLLDENDPAAGFNRGRMVEWPAVLEAAGYSRDEVLRLTAPAAATQAKPERGNAEAA